MEIELLSDVCVELVDSMGSDASFVRAARVSTRGRNEVVEPAEGAGLIRYLMRSRHGSVFEHAAVTFFVEAPIFTFREFHRHRMASYNEMSGRYRRLAPRFYVPGPERKLVNVGTSARPEFAPGTLAQYQLVESEIAQNCAAAWERYQRMLDDGVANEMARAVLPVNVMSQMYCTMNPRGLMNFLSLRVDSPDSAVRSRPQWEIQMVAEKMEAEFAALFPLTHAAFVDGGRVAP